MKNSINERIDEIISELGITNEVFGKEMGFTEATARNLRKNGVVKQAYIETISKKWGYNEKWIKKGTGAKFNPLSRDLQSNISIELIEKECLNRWDELMKREQFKSRYYLQLTKTLNMDIDEIFENVLNKRKVL